MNISHAKAVDAMLTERANTVIELFRSISTDTPVVAVAYFFLETLCSNNDEKGIHWSNVLRESVPKMPISDRYRAVGLLVHLNLFSYADANTIVLHCRSLKWAYLNHVKSEKYLPDLLEIVKPALATYKQDLTSE